MHAFHDTEDHPHGRGPGRGRGRGRGWGGPGGGPRRRGPRVGRGETRTAILLVLLDGPQNPYQVMSELEERSGGRWRPSPGSVYPTVKTLALDGLITIDEEDGRRRLSLTDEGRTIAETKRDAGPPPWETIAEPGAHHGLVEQSQLLLAAAQQVGEAGTDEQIERATQRIAELRRGLYAMLAEDPSDMPGPTSDA
jgi:DNA-binding PadR family transcriptional regulator